MAEKPSYEELEQRIRELETANKSRSSLETLFELSLDMLCVADFDGHFRLVNSAFERVLGYSIESLLDRPFIELVHPDDRAKTLAAMEQLATGKPIRYFENRYRCEDGTYKWLAWTSMPVADERITYAIARDITEQKTMQEELTRQRDLFNNLLRNVPASIFWKDTNSVFLGANERFIRDTGYQSQKEIIGKTDYDLAWTKQQADFYRECDNQVISTGKSMLNIEESQQQADGTTINLLTSKVPLTDSSGKIKGLLGIYMDITKLKLAEATLAKSEARLQTLFNSAAEFIYVIDPEGVIINANHHACENSGYAEDEVIGKNIKEFFTDESQNTCDCNFPGLRERGYNRADIEFVCKDGHVIDMECSATAVPDENGDFTTYLIIQRDVTERKRGATALANSERQFRAVFNSIYQLIGVLDPDGTLIDANQTALDFFGLEKEEVEGVPFWDIYCWSYSNEVQDRLKAAIRTASHGTPVRYEEDLLGKDNSVRTIDVTLKPVVNQQGKVALIIPEGRDITNQKRSENERQRHQQEMAHVMRLSTMGEMASGMAHELNQPLTALISYCGTALKLVEDTPSLPKGYLDILQRATWQAHRAGDVIRHLREFVSKSSNEKTSIVLNDLAQDVIEFISWELRDNGIQITILPHSSACEVFIDKIQIEQVIMNLIRNSIEAIRQAGIPEGRIDIAIRQAGNDSIELCITDNGPGITPSMADSLFEPYRTSKDNGMGMGLSISRSIIENHNGRLWADTQRQQGALFCMSIPGCV